MSSSYTSNLRLVLPVQGELSGTWGDTVNAGLTNLTDSSIAGYTTVSVTSANQAFTVVNGGADQARSAFIKLTTTTVANFAVYAPPVTKGYVIYNSTAYTATVYNSTVSGNTTAAGTGVAIPAGRTTTIYSDGTNFLSKADYLPALNSTPIGATTPSTGAFTTLSSTGGALNGTLGATTPSTVAATTISASGTITSTATSGSLKAQASADTTYSVEWRANYSDPNTAEMYVRNTLRMRTATNGSMKIYDLSAAERVDISSTGLSVTGILSATKGYYTDFSGSASGSISANNRYLGQWEDTTNFRQYYTGGSGSTYPVVETYLTYGGGASVTKILSLSSTGLAVTGALSSSGVVTTGGATSTGLSGGDVGLPNSSAIRWRNGANSAYLNAIYVDSSNNLQLGGNGATADTIFSNSGIGETMRLASGNLGLGVTPQSWSVLKGLEIGGFHNSVYADNGSFEIGLVNNLYWNGGWKYSSTTASAVSLFKVNAGQFAWQTATGGTANAAATVTTALTLDSNAALSVNGRNTTGSVANGATANFLTFTAAQAGTYLMTMRQAGQVNGGIRAVAFIHVGSGGTLTVDSIIANGMTIAASATANTVQVTNSAGGATAFDFAYIKFLG